MSVSVAMRLQLPLPALLTLSLAFARRFIIARCAQIKLFKIGEKLKWKADK
jgi:hypothetical protein